MTSPESARRERIRRFEADVLVHVDDLYRAALRLTGQASEAEDLTQDTCLRAYECLDQLRNPAAARVWVFTILRSIFLRHIERQPKLVSLDDLEASRLVASEILRDSYETVLPLGESPLADVRAGLARLPMPYREPMVLAHVGGFAYKEIAQILAIPLGTVMSRLFRGRRLLRSALREHRSTSTSP